VTAVADTGQTVQNDLPCPIRSRTARRILCNQSAVEDVRVTNTATFKRALARTTGSASQLAQLQASSNASPSISTRPFWLFGRGFARFCISLSLCSRMASAPMPRTAEPGSIRDCRRAPPITDSRQARLADAQSPLILSRKRLAPRQACFAPGPDSSAVVFALKRDRPRVSTKAPVLVVPRKMDVRQNGTIATASAALADIGVDISAATGAISPCPAPRNAS